MINPQDNAAARGPTLFLLPNVSEDDPPAVRDVIAARNVATTTGRCPICGATRSRRDRRAVERAKPGQVIQVTFMHEAGCPVPNPWGGVA